MLFSSSQSTWQAFCPQNRRASGGAIHKECIKEWWQKQPFFFLQVLAPVKLLLGVSLGVLSHQQMKASQGYKDWRIGVPQAFGLSAHGTFHRYEYQLTLTAQCLYSPQLLQLCQHRLWQCLVLQLYIPWDGLVRLIASNVPLIKSTNSLWMSLKLMLHFLRFNPDQQRLFKTTEHHRFVE